MYYFYTILLYYFKVSISSFIFILLIGQNIYLCIVYTLHLYPFIIYNKIWCTTQIE